MSSLNDHFELMEVGQEQHYKSNYDTNNVQIDMPMHSDLNKKETCTDLLDYAMQLNDQMLETKCEEGWEDIPPLCINVPMYLLGDGNPTFTMSTVMREQNEKYKENVQPYTGGFHCGLEGHCKRGHIFGVSLLEDVFSCWRESGGQLRWVMNPGDPNQINAELIMYELAMNAVAIHSIIHCNGGTGDKVEISPKWVVNHMLNRAREWPIVMLALSEMRFAHLIFMLNDSEERSDSELFITVQKYFLQLFASTHCTKYMSMFTDFFVKWYCCSPAEKNIFAQAVFTRKTKINKSVFAVSYTSFLCFIL